LIGIKARVGQQLISDFQDWCQPASSDALTQ
jgi:hypothetical protein